MIVILGHGGHARAVLDLVTSSGEAAFRTSYEHVRNHVVADGATGIVGIGCSDLGLRVMLFTCLRSMGLAPAPPFACGRQHLLEIGLGTVAFSGCILGHDVRIGSNVVIYSGCVVEHGSMILDHAWLSPGVVLCGNVTVKPRAFLGAGAIVLPGVTIGEGARIGAGAVIHRDVDDGVTVYGPRDRDAGAMQSERNEQRCSTYPDGWPV